MPRRKQNPDVVVLQEKIVIEKEPKKDVKKESDGNKSGSKDGIKKEAEKDDDKNGADIKITEEKKVIEEKK